jgi:prepilin-type N-terminal cleavage/methylation domain-containing protein
MRSRTDVPKLIPRGRSTGRLPGNGHNITQEEIDVFELIKNRIAEKRDSEKGFTLVELLVVIVILGILAAVVVFAVGGINDKGQEAACKADKKALQTAEEAYFAKNSAYVNESALVPQYLHEESELYNATASEDAKSYTVAVQDTDCTGI